MSKKPSTADSTHAGPEARNPSQPILHGSGLIPFRPATEIDFLRYAKSVSKVLASPLQEAQELLARIYGYAGLHELQVTLKKEGLPGPFLDQPPADYVFGLENNSQWRSRIDRRILDQLIVWYLERDKKTRSFLKRYSLLIEMGLFCSPKTHREMMGRITDFLNTDWRITPAGYPFGYPGAMAWAFWSRTENVAAYLDFERQECEFQPEEDSQMPSQMLEAYRKSRAPVLFNAICEELCEDDHEDGDVYQQALRIPDELDEFVSSVDLYDYEGEFWDLVDTHIHHYFMMLCHGENPPASQESQRMAQFLLNPTEKNANACGITEKIPDICKKLPGWRMGVMWALSKLIGNDDVSSEKENFDVIECHARLSGHWHDENSPILSLVGKLTDKGRFSDTNRWGLSLIISMKNEKTGLMEPAGRIAGTYVNAVKDNTCMNLDNWRSELDDQGDSAMLRTLEAFEAHYLKRLGFEDIYEWVCSGDAHSLALVSLAIAEPYKGMVDEHHLLDLFKKAMTPWNMEFEGGSVPAEIRGDGDFFEDDESEFELAEGTRKCENFAELGVVLIPLFETGALAVSIFEGERDYRKDTITEKVNRMIRCEGCNVSANSWGRIDPQSNKNYAKVKTLLSKAALSSVDVIIFDPFDILFGLNPGDSCSQRAMSGPEF